jgi:hypothetical protein
MYLPAMFQINVFNARLRGGGQRNRERSKYMSSMSMKAGGSDKDREREREKDKEKREVRRCTDQSHLFTPTIGPF